VKVRTLAEEEEGFGASGSSVDFRLDGVGSGLGV
jgi:hypothetical protein